jgi:hypothetical protein
MTRASCEVVAWLFGFSRWSLKVRHVTGSQAKRRVAASPGPR